MKQNLDKEYAGITGVPAFAKAAALLAYGRDSKALSEDRVAITQSISGTGALRIGGAFLERHFPGDKTIYIPNPSWANHSAVFKDSGLKVEKYRYYNAETIGLDFDGMVEDIKKMPKGSAVLLHACAHNPTGIDPTEEQWRAISTAVKEGGHYPFFDMAYQGFASGDTNKDAFPVRLFIEEGHGLCLAQSFAKNMVSAGWLGASEDRVGGNQDRGRLTSGANRGSTASVWERSRLCASLWRRRSGWILRSRSLCDRCTRTRRYTERGSRRRFSTTSR